MTAPTSDADRRTPAHGWRRRERPPRLERRLEFPDYEQLRDFLDGAAELSEATDVYPNMSFGRTYVNLTLFADEDSGDISAEAQQFAERIDALAQPPEDSGP